MCNQSLKKVLIWPKNFFFFFFKPKKGQKTQNFTLISKPLKKFWKMHQKKLLAKTWWKNALFSLLLMSVKLVLLITFFGAFYNNFFNGFEISVKSAFLTPFWFFFFNFLGHISTFFKLWSQTVKKGSKNQETYFVNVS